jgi:hypothetical protein
MTQKNQNTNKIYKYEKARRICSRIYAPLSLILSIAADATVMYFGCSQLAHVVIESKRPSIVQEYIETDEKIKKLDTLESSLKGIQQNIDFDSRRLLEQFPSFNRDISLYQDSITSRRGSLIEQNKERAKNPQIVTYIQADEHFMKSLSKSLYGAICTLFGTFLGISGIYIGNDYRLKRKIKRLQE